MEIFAFKLTMPNVGSWNGRWSREKDLHVKFVRMTKDRLAETGLEEGNYGYNFGDGWFANVQVFKVSGEERRELNKRSKGFAGYDWMIDSIIEHGRIITDDEEDETDW